MMRYFLTKLMTTTHSLINQNIRHMSDFAAGLCVAGLLLPEAVAYAGLAHLPVAHALTAMLTGLALYALFGGSRFAIVAPTSATATFTAAAAVSIPMASTSPQAFTTVLMALVLMAGIVLILLSVAKQGQLSAFVSRPVLRGFAFALAITIVIKQIPDAAGLEIPRSVGSDPISVLLYAVPHIGSWHMPSLAVALVAGALVALLKQWPRIPALMVAIVVAIVAAQVFNLANLGVHEVGSIEPPSFQFAWPELSKNDWLSVAELAFGLVVLIFAESWGSVRALALAHGDKLDANRELMVLGACNATSALMQGMAVGAGFSASSANAGAGSQSRWSGVVALVMVALALVFALPALHLLPRPVLAVAVIAALWHSLSPAPLIAVWAMRRDRLLIVGAVLAVLFFGVLHGMLAAIALSIFEALRRFSQPALYELGQLGDTRNYVALERQAHAKALPGVLILRPEEPLFFANAERITADVLTLATARQATASVALHSIILSLEESSDLDSTAVECLRELDGALVRANQTLLLARVKDPVRELLSQCDPQGLGAVTKMFFSVDDAVTSTDERAPK